MASLRRTALLLLAAAATRLGAPSPAAAQSGAVPATVRTAENFRKSPNGQLLAHLDTGTPLSVVGHQGRWLEVVMNGWVWSQSLQLAKREGLDLVVSASGGENLRGEPSGDILGRLAQGMLLREVERRPGWVHVQRKGWIWGPSVNESTPTGSSARGGGSGGTARPASSRPARGSTRPSVTPPVRVSIAGAGGAPILSAPGGDTVGRADPGTEMEVVTRQGSWARVRLEGWTWLPRGDSTAASTDSTEVLTPADLGRHPQAFRGRVVSWQLQFISLEHAEKVRTDFFEGEPFLLTRFGGPDGPFVYVAVPTTRVEEMRGLIPLERIKVTGRIRTGASSLTGTPIIDLVSLERTGKSP